MQIVSRERKHCRYCKASLATGQSSCPHCKRAQSYRAEWIALIFLALVIAGSLWLQFSASSPNNWTSPSEPLIHTANQQNSTLSQLTISQSHSQFPSPERSTQAKLTFFTPSKQIALPKRSSANSQISPPTSNTYSRYQQSRFRQQTQSTFPFYVAAKKWNTTTERYDFYRVGMQGNERIILSDTRRYFLSENQKHYPQPESGCGPTALLNLYIWYTKFGLIKESVRHSDLEHYKQLKFLQIDRKIAEIQGHARNSDTGTNVLEQAVAIDEIVKASSQGSVRIHFEYKAAPLKIQDFTQLSRNYRAGILAVRAKNLQTGQLMENHAVLVIRGDTSGKISIANWGEFSHGRLVQKSDGQWFIPDDPAQYELLIEQLTTLIPFTPSG